MQAENKTQVLVAVIGLLGVLGGGLFANWDKIFKSSVPVQVQSTTPTVPSVPSTPSVASPTVVKPVATPSVVPTVKQNIVPTKPAADQNVGVSTLDIDGYWVDQNGINYQIIQNDPGHFEIIVTDGNTSTYGSGTISGRNMRFEYQNQDGSMGFGAGLISANQTMIQATINDSGSGKFQITLRQQ
jgi:hypothetical protein